MLIDLLTETTESKARDVPDSNF